MFSSFQWTWTQNWLLRLAALPSVFNNPPQKSIFHFCVEDQSHHFLLDISVSFGVARRVFFGVLIAHSFALNFFLEVLKHG
jgi:hypothetical protein